MSFVSAAFFGSKNVSNGSGSRTKKIAVNISFLLRWTAIKTKFRLGSYAVFRKACFLPLK